MNTQRDRINGKNSFVFGILGIICMSIVSFASVDSVLAADVAIDAVNFPDQNFREYVLTNFDKNKDGKEKQ